MKSFTKKLLHYAVPVLSVLALGFYVDFGTIGQALAQSSLLGILVFFVTTCAFVLLHCARLAYLLDVPLVAGADATLSVAWMRMFAPDFVISAARWAILSRYVGSRANAFAGLAYGQIVNGIVMLAALWVFFVPVGVLPTISVALACVEVVVVLHKLGKLPKSVLLYLCKPLSFHLTAIVLHVGIVAMTTLIWYTGILAVGAYLPLKACLWAQLCSSIISKIPWTIGDIGIKEGIVAWMAHVHGISPETAVLIMALLRATWLVLVVGAITRPLWCRRPPDNTLDAEVYPLWGCNLNCPICVQRKFTDKCTHVLSEDQFRAFLDSLERQGHKLRTLEFSGGEPTLWKPLRWAAQEVKRRGLAQRVVVLTNGIGHKPEDFEGFDLVRVTNYGAINRKWILRLQQALGRRRFKSSWVVHREVEIDGPIRSPDEAWPARCASPSINLGPDGMVYACGANAIEQRDGIDISQDFVSILRATDVYRQRRCLNCPSNHRIQGVQYGDKDLLGLVLEFGIWGTPIGVILHFPRLNWWRWRYLRSRYYRRATV